MKFDVHRYGPGGFEIVTVDADGGDDAALKAFKPGTLIRYIGPSEVQDEPVKRGRTQGEDA
jgi:hypothetical protein